MPFIGVYTEPKTPREGCLTPRWTYFIPHNTLWQCPKCGIVYRMYKQEDIYGSTTREWVKQEG